MFELLDLESNYIDLKQNIQAGIESTVKYDHVKVRVFLNVMYTLKSIAIDTRMSTKIIKTIPFELVVVQVFIINRLIDCGLISSEEHLNDIHNENNPTKQ